MEFSEVIKQYNRMCSSYNDCHNCSFFNNGCSKDLWNIRPHFFEETVMNWVHKNPEPIYPTILEIVRHIAAYLPEREDGKSWVHDIPISDTVMERIPESIAKEFGIVPINEGGLSKYCEEEESEWR